MMSRLGMGWLVKSTTMAMDGDHELFYFNQVVAQKKVDIKMYQIRLDYTLRDLASSITSLCSVSWQQIVIASNNNSILCVQRRTPYVLLGIAA
jgi:hypothetical protein